MKGHLKTRKQGGQGAGKQTKQAKSKQLSAMMMKDPNFHTAKPPPKGLDGILETKTRQVDMIGWSLSTLFR